MTSAETKVIVLALLVLSVGLFYTNINQKGSITGGAATTDKNVYIKEPQTYDQETDYAPPQEYVQPQQQVPQSEAQQQFIGQQVAELKRNGDTALSVCSKLKGGPLESLYNNCLITMSDEFDRA